MKANKQAGGEGLDWQVGCHFRCKVAFPALCIISHSWNLILSNSKCSACHLGNLPSAHYHPYVKGRAGGRETGLLSLKEKVRRLKLMQKTKVCQLLFVLRE